MGTSSSWRLRLIGIVFLFLAFWQSKLMRPGIANRFGGSLPLTLLWVAGLLGLQKARFRPWMAGLMVVTGALLVRLLPSMGSAFLLSFGICGYQLSWRWFKWLGIPLVMAGTLWLNMPLHGTFNQGLIDSAISLAVVFLLGRLARDRTESQLAKTKAMADLQQAHKELQVYAAQVEELSALRERTRLARELHDTMGHALSAITVQLEAARRLQRRDPAAVEPLLVETQALTRKSMQELRQYLSGLRGGAEGGDLAAQVTKMAEEAAARNGWQLELQVAAPALPDNARRALVRIVREALTNVECHAAAKRVKLTLWSADGAICLEVRDDGRGFDPGAIQSGHYGLQGMRERLAELGGDLEIESGPGRGCQVTARFPDSGTEA